MLVRREKLTIAERQSALGLFRALPLRVDHEMATLAVSTLCCKDGPLRKAAVKHGVAVWD